ncbi:MAG: GAF domain-containing protein, partial [Ktedonobacteraceae bacterium]|nr:GAF domain-containing protein [Ktedonobacteraceae bacterium]
MRFLVRSIGGKLIVVATLTLLLCMLLFMVLAWSLLRFYSEHEATGNARSHLMLTTQAYRTYSTGLIKTMEQVAQSFDLTALSSPPLPRSTQDHLRAQLAPIALNNHLAALDIFTPNHHLLVQLEQPEKPGQPLSADMNHLLDQAISGQSSIVLQQSNGSWSLNIATPIPVKGRGGFSGVLLASQRIDSYFAQILAQKAGQNLALCLGQQVQGTTGETAQQLIADERLSLRDFCTPGQPNIIQTSRHYLTLAEQVQLGQQMPHTPGLVIVATEPIYTLSVGDSRQLLLLLGLGICTLALGVIVYTLITGLLFIQPLRRLQTYARAQVASAAPAEEPIELPDTDELNTLTQSFDLLSRSIDSENQAHTAQLSNLLVMSDTLISTLNLEQLLGEVVARLGNIMQAKHVSLLLYGRETASPWAVAQWSDQQVIDAHMLAPRPTSSPEGQQAGTVSVHADPDSDITTAVTTKLVALPSHIRPPTSSGKRAAIRAPKITSEQAIPKTYGLRRPRIPRGALRDLDMILARMVIQRKKIACGEDIETIYRERQEPWARLALDAGYRSAIAVPLLLQDQAIGAFILYTDQPQQVNSHDTFLLSTVAIQTSMAVQNALLFAEVKDKNAALERANQLKSQFLANVTHELRTPLHSIISYGALLLEGFVDGELTQEQEEHIQFVVRRAEDLSHLVDDMLDLSKIEADRIEVRLEPLALDSSLE